jgi:hypothetical protein
VPLTQEGAGRTDLDGDGTLDCWQLSYDGGNAYGWWTMTVQAPCESPPLSIRLGGSFGAFISVADLPHALVDRPRLLDGVLAHWFGHDARRTLASIDGSLAWLVEHYSHNERSTPRDGWRPDTSYTPRWSSGAPALPDLQVVTLLTPSEQEVGAQLAAQLAVDDEQHRPGPFVLVYFAHNHHKLSPSTSTSNLAVYVTDHGIAVEDRRDKRWSWAFIATERYRLRTPSIGRTASDGGLIRR